MVILILLVKSNPRTCRKQDTSPAELSLITSSGNPHPPVERLIEKLRQGVTLQNYSAIEAAVRQMNPTAADTLVTAAFEESEKLVSTRPIIIDLVQSRPPSFLQKWPEALQQRYFRFLVNFGKANASKADDDISKRIARNALALNLEYITDNVPDLSADLRYLQTQMKLRPLAAGTYLDEMNRRIALSTDKVKQSLTEAEAAPDRGLKVSMPLISRSICISCEAARPSNRDCRVCERIRAGRLDGS